MALRMDELMQMEFARSFDPREWYDHEDDIDFDAGATEAKIMWVYLRSGPETWTVGFYTPERQWNADSDHTSKEAAAARVHYLNGGA